jgi:Ran GTPase-activating protein (RanGAP) involved in mRNA processing and transport
MRLWDEPAAGAVLCAALTGHPRLRAINLAGNRVPSRADSGAALAALVAANAPALQQLNVSDSELGDAGMGPLVDALRHNTHLTKLDCTYNFMSEAFARDRLLPAVRANSSLRTLIVTPPPMEMGRFLGRHSGATESARKAAALVAARAQQPRA